MDAQNIFTDIYIVKWVLRLFLEMTGTTENFGHSKGMMEGEFQEEQPKNSTKLGIRKKYVEFRIIN